MSEKIYAKIEFTEKELEHIRSAVSIARSRIFEQWFEKKDNPNTEEAEIKWLESSVDFYGDLMEKLEKPFMDDTSQDGGSIFEDEKQSGYR